MSSSVLSVCVADAERVLTEVAEESLMNRRVIEIPVDQWHQIESMLTEPARVIPAVQELFTHLPKQEG